MCVCVCVCVCVPGVTLTLLSVILMLTHSMNGSHKLFIRNKLTGNRLEIHHHMFYSSDS